MAECSGTCKGECTVEFMAPQCEAKLEPPSCECSAAADCQASCDGQASLKAECTPPSIEIVAEGSIDAEFVATLEANLPAVFEVFAQSEVVANAMVQVVSDAGGIIGELDAQCAASFGGKLTAKVEAAVSASASVNVSVMASADVSGEASSG
jgi:hypothetical protein